MALSLKIENETQLPDGGPLSVMVSGKRNIDIGRDSHLDWTLPDPTRFISSKHAEIRYKDGGYWLHDVSTNGTFLNGGDHRMQAPHRLRNGDRFTIGHYIIAVTLDADQADVDASPAAPSPPAPAYQELWVNQQDLAPPIDRAHLKAPRERAAPINPDFLDWAADVPSPDSFNAAPARQAAPATRSDDDMSWAVGPMSPGPAPPPPAPDMPSPRRPVWTTEPETPWAAEPGGQSRPARPPPEGASLAAAAAARPIRGAAPAPTPAVSASSGEFAASELFLRRLSQAAGVPEELFTQKDPGELADEIGLVMRLVVDNVMQLLNARVQAKRLARSSNHTLVQAFDNNPLKFAPSAEDALRIMFGPPTQSYLDARRAIEQGFGDLKSHQIKTYSAMQHALTLLLADLDPQSIDRDTDAGRGIAALVTSRKAKLWDAYVARWQAQIRREGGGLVDSFMLLFADCYDRDSSEMR
jgi:type VI secretion system protein ImpI